MGFSDPLMVSTRPTGQDASRQRTRVESRSGLPWPPLQPWGCPAGMGPLGRGGEDGAAAGLESGASVRCSVGRPGARSRCVASGKVTSGSGSELEASPLPSKPPAPSSSPLLRGFFSLKKILRDFLERAIRESRRPMRSRRLRGQPSPLPPRQERRVPGSQGRRRPAYPNSAVAQKHGASPLQLPGPCLGGTRGCL